MLESGSVVNVVAMSLLV